jgi:hypothetical protein
VGQSQGTVLQTVTATQSPQGVTRDESGGLILVRLTVPHVSRVARNGEAGSVIRQYLL